MKAKICNIIRKHWHVKLMFLLILLFLAFMPIIINWLYGFNAPFECFEEPSKWSKQMMRECVYTGACKSH